MHKWHALWDGMYSCAVYDEVRVWSIMTLKNKQKRETSIRPECHFEADQTCSKLNIQVY